MTLANWWYDEVTGSHFCGDCDEREFGSEDALFQHLRMSSYHIWCEVCDREFGTYEARTDHYTNSSAHYYCTLCHTDFDGNDDLGDHQSESHAKCNGCNKVFNTEADLASHASWYCLTHKRCFKTADNLKMHMNSSAHLPAIIACPTGCGRNFISYSAATIHLESGGCSSGIDRRQVNYYIRQWDQAGFITDSQRALPAPPSFSPNQTPPQQHFATEASWSSIDQAYKCYFDNRLFGSLHSLNQHLSSAVHTYSTHRNEGGEKLYHCPNMQDCGKEFLTLSALMQHVEQGNCGVRSMPGVKNAIDGVMRGMNRLTL